MHVQKAPSPLPNSVHELLYMDQNWDQGQQWGSGSHRVGPSGWQGAKGWRLGGWALRNGNLGTPLKRWLRICSKMAAKFTNSSDESSMGSAVYFSRRVFTENLGEGQGRRVMVAGEGHQAWRGAEGREES